MNETFISYSRKDSEFVTKLFDSLKKAGIDPWFDLEDLRPATEWKKEILINIQACHNFVFIISANSIKSPYCEMELNHALLHDKRIIPIVAERVNPDDCQPALSEINWIFFDDFAQGLAQLLEILDAPFGLGASERLNSKIEVLTAGKDPRYFFLYRQRYLLGRNPAGNIADSGLIFINDPFVSRNHLTLECKDGRWTALDGGIIDKSYSKSRNGVRINGLQIKPKYCRPLRHGDTIAISSATLIFYSEIFDEVDATIVDDKDTISSQDD